VLFLKEAEENSFKTLVQYPTGKKNAYLLPKMVETIGARAFYDCDGLTQISFNDGLKTIEDEAFFDCDLITEIVLPESVRKIKSLAFASCNELRSFTVNSNLTAYERNAFDGCWYTDYNSVKIVLDEKSISTLLIIIVLLAAIGVAGVLVYRKKIRESDAAAKAALAARNAEAEAEDKSEK
jgi:hypothetical protein